ncbi:hypothetical protein Cpin_0209 [Chitinophaga pinensis DSM 2588]|uniref:Uncharacterized protein n=1 Tax=Chitinophaga pinensis (strain ATCC 43595 / DSM 2588 / LMG 13176 / NBRC 15968 / NCIMB 11800 / UQM 2034) TaxID=485918 RepID=A0A979GS50_CHIPD|nr:hypothetical protein Cpin_0209 [Chitinophaga pinensis DSM 2588]
MAEKLPDAYWFKSYMIIATPLLSVVLVLLSNWIFNSFHSIFKTLYTVCLEWRVARSVRELKKIPYASESDIHQLEMRFIKVKSRRRKR